MIIFISDLHVFDGTAGPENIPLAAYTGAFGDIGQMVSDAKAEDVKLVYLGDIFDLIRTAAWQDPDVQPDEKPWGAHPTVRKPLEIMNKIIQHPCFDVLGGDLTKYGFPASTERIYIPGNHDRLLNIFPELLATAEQKLGLQRGADSGKPFPHYFQDKAHRCFARHGHEFDFYNFGGSEAFSGTKWVEIPESDYRRTPIGDVIAAEFASALPLAVEQRLKKPNPALITRLRNMFDLRPTGAIPAYLAYEVEHAGDSDVQDAIMDGIHERVRAFRDLPFVQQWFHERDKWYNPFDKADKLQILLKVLDYLEFGFIKRVLPVADHFSHFMPEDDNMASDAAQEFLRLNSPESPFRDDGLEFVLYGHTHKPEQRLIDVVGTAETRRPRTYLNTGMWRPGQEAGFRSGFTQLKHLTFSIVYKAGERANSKGESKPHPTYEVWTGALKDD